MASLQTPASNWTLTVQIFKNRYTSEEGIMAEPVKVGLLARYLQVMDKTEYMRINSKNIRVGG